METQDQQKAQVFIVGSKGIPAQYGGFETFVDKLTKYSGEAVDYHVACQSPKKCEFFYHNARCIGIPVPSIGPAKAIWYDCVALKTFIHYCRMHPEIERPIFYVLACRIGFIISHYSHQIHQLGGVLYVNPDGQEWKRKKWSLPVRRYWKYSERRMIRSADLIICDSMAIEADIRQRYAKYNPKTLYIAYGAEKPVTDEKKADEWLESHALKKNDYYILVGRFVPENNFEQIIREFMSSHTSRKLAIITGENPRLRAHIEKITGCGKDSRICFVGTVYDPPLLCAIRQNAYASFHGHEVGGTNPSLLEGMLCTKVNLVLDVVFNREVCGDDGALYWTKQPGNLCKLIHRVENMDKSECSSLGQHAVLRMQKMFSWEGISAAYQSIFEEKHI